MNRRGFLKASLAGMGAAMTIRVLDPIALAQDKPAEPAKKAVLRLASQEGPMGRGSLREKVEKLEKWGCAGIELGGSPDVKAAKEAIKGTSIKIGALCWGSHNGDLVSPDEEKRKKGIADLKVALQKAGELESTGVIFVPCFNGQSKLKPEELDKVMADILPEIGDFAQKAASRLLLEPLTKGETFYINRLEQAAAICNKINNPGICMMGDFYHMSKEETDQTQAFVTGGKWVHQVHLATKAHRIAPGLEPHSFIEGMKGLKKIGFQDFCSLECGVPDKIDGQPATHDEVLQHVFAFLRKQWEEAVI